MSIRVAKSQGVWGKSAKLGRGGAMAKPRVLSISTKSKVQRVKAFLRVLKYSTGGVLGPANIYKLKHLSKIEVVSNDPSGCTFTLGFDNLRNQSVAPPHWTMRNIDDRNRLVMCMFNICKDVLGRIPKVVGIDVVEMALWAKPPTDVADPKYADILLLENYAAFQNSLYDLANVVPTLAKFYHQASESYEQACTRHISVIIYYHFERLFQFARKIADLMYTITPEEIPFQLGLSKSDLRKVVKSSLSGSIMAMYKKSQKNLTSEELLPSLWDKCKKEFLDKYDNFAQFVAKIYPSEHIPSVSEMRDLLASM